MLGCVCDEKMREGCHMGLRTKTRCVRDASTSRSKRVMEKCGFVFDRIERDVPCELMGDMRDERFACLTQSGWVEGLLT